MVLTWHGYEGNLQKVSAISIPRLHILEISSMLDTLNNLGYRYKYISIKGLIFASWGVVYTTKIPIEYVSSIHHGISAHSLFLLKFRVEKKCSMGPPMQRYNS